MITDIHIHMEFFASFAVFAIKLFASFAVFAIDLFATLAGFAIKPLAGFTISRFDRGF
ncbi:MAG: hypothetical protein IPM66_22665 [Acidobacteriota bacterium]|nr:MAG: hypothetical protein IPM66_22665 [Acidobacteriota bacterium]